MRYSFRYGPDGGGDTVKEELQLVQSDNQWRKDDDDITQRPEEQAVFPRLTADLYSDLILPGVCCPRFLVLHQLDSPHHAATPYVPYVG